MNNHWLHPMMNDSNLNFGVSSRVHSVQLNFCSWVYVLTSVCWKRVYCAEFRSILFRNVFIMAIWDAYWAYTQCVGPLCAKMEPRKPQNASMCVKFRTAQGWARIKQAIVDTLWQQTENEGLEQAGWKCRYFNIKMIRNELHTASRLVLKWVYFLER